MDGQTDGQMDEQMNRLSLQECWLQSLYYRAWYLLIYFPSWDDLIVILFCVLDFWPKHVTNKGF